jgi:hypothetical protein
MARAQQHGSARYEYSVQGIRTLSQRRKNKTPPRRGFVVSPDIRYQSTILAEILSIPECYMRILRGVLASLGHRIAKPLDAGKRRSPAQPVSQSLQTARPTLRSGLFCDVGLVTLKLSYKTSNNANATRG